MREIKLALGKTFIAELRRRRVFGTAAIYIVGAWVAIQVVGQALPAFNTPGEAIRYAWLAAIFIFPIALLFAWRYDLSASGVVRTPAATAGENPDVSLRRSDYLILIVLLGVSSAAISTEV